jgi:hypothetical protein
MKKTIHIGEALLNEAETAPGAPTDMAAVRLDLEAVVAARSAKLNQAA